MRVGSVLGRGEKVRFQYLVDFFQNFRDAQVRGLGDSGGKVFPEAGQKSLVILFTSGNLVEFLFQLGGEVVADILPEIVLQEGDHQPALVLGDQAVLFLADVVAVLDRGDDRGIGGRAPDAKLFHALDQCRLGIARRRLGEVLVGVDRVFLHRFALGDLRQAVTVLVV